MEVGTEAEAALETGTSSSVFSSSILGTAGESDESSLSIFLWKDSTRTVHHYRTSHFIHHLFVFYHSPLHCWRLLTDKMDAWRESLVSSGCLWLTRHPPAPPQWQSGENKQFLKVVVNLLHWQHLWYVLLLRRGGLLSVDKLLCVNCDVFDRNKLKEKNDVKVWAAFYFEA